ARGHVAMTEDEVEVVAAELAKAGGVVWYPGRERGPLKHVVNRYRDRARLAIAALDRFRARLQGTNLTDSIDIGTLESSSGTSTHPAPDHSFQAGSLVLYRPPGDRRAYPCRVDKVEGSRVHLVPEIKACTGWIDVSQLSPVRADGHLEK
ncbi:MAG TPA: hypothetical protein VM899_10315, partial [Rubellimicrobium sp.]|nr:hypothetical protein [Rubellimicrobium sp.]